MKADAGRTDSSGDVARVEAAFGEAMVRLRSVVETAADGIVTIDERGIIDSINPAGARMFGYEPPELIGKNVSMLMPQPYAGEHDRYVADYLRTGMAKIIGIGRELFALRRDGTTFPMRLAVSEMALSGRRQFTGIIADLSDRRMLERQVLESAAAEQRRIGQDLHDGMCQQLGAAGFAIEMLRRKSERGEAIEPAQFEKVQTMLRDSTNHLRQIAHGMQPVNFRVGGLPEALRELAATTSERFRISCRARCASAVNIEDETTADHLYRIAQEATGNAVRHGKADAVRIQLAVPNGGGVSLIVLDNGVGFASSAAAGATAAAVAVASGSPQTKAGMGLRIMKYRADAIGADFRVSARRRGRGAAIWCVLPPRRG